MDQDKQSCYLYDIASWFTYFGLKQIFFDQNIFPQHDILPVTTFHNVRHAFLFQLYP